MDRNVHIEGKLLSIASYRPKPGQEDALMKLVEKHLPKLRELEFATDRQNFIGRAQNGTIVEVFEWASMSAVSAAHQHPAISDIWEKMSLVADFFPINTLDEMKGPFADFKMLN